MAKQHKHRVLLIAVFLMGLCSYIDQVVGLPVESNEVNAWPFFNKRNIAALARDGFSRPSPVSYKRSISTLAKNGQLPTFRSPYDENDKQEDEGEINEKRNIASIARLRSYAAAKRNVQALARDGYRVGRPAQYSQQNDKRNIQSLARDGFRGSHKREEQAEQDYDYPLYSNADLSPSMMDTPLDYNDIYDLQQSINPDLFPSLSRMIKRNPELDYYAEPGYDTNVDWYNKRSAIGLPVHGIYRSSEPGRRNKRYILLMPDPIERNDIPRPEYDTVGNEDKRSVDDQLRDNFEKRHIASIARLGLLPYTRFTDDHYSRSGRDRLFLPSREIYREYPPHKNFGIREYISNTEAEPAIYTDDTNLSPPSLFANSHPTGRILHRPLNNELPPPPNIIRLKVPKPKYRDVFSKNIWQSEIKEAAPFRSFKMPSPYHISGKRYLVLPAIDNIMYRKSYPNSSLPSRRKNQ